MKRALLLKGGGTMYLKNQPRATESPLCFRYRRLMRAALLLAFFTFFLQPAALAQGNDARVWAYFFGGAGGVFSEGESEGAFHGGGGGEGLLFGGFGLAGELGYLSGLQHGNGVFSLGLLGAFNRDQETVPFVTGGYTLCFGSERDPAHGLYVGGGINRWFGDHWGIRIEGRYQAVTTGFDDMHVVEGRFGIIIG